MVQSDDAAGPQVRGGGYVALAGSHKAAVAAPRAFRSGEDLGWLEQRGVAIVTGGEVICMRPCMFHCAHKQTGHDGTSLTAHGVTRA